MASIGTTGEEMMREALKVGQPNCRKEAQPISASAKRFDSALFYVDHTCRFERNTGIQRCVRSLSRALLDLGIPLQPVIWNRQTSSLEPASSKQRQHMARWGGPHPSQWLDAHTSSSSTLAQARWLLIAELVSGPHNPTTAQLARDAEQRGLNVAWLFHDAIPVRWAHLYGCQAQRAAEAHAQYMRGLAQFDLVLANSRTTANHLSQFWREQQIQPNARLHSVPLAAELPGTQRLPPPQEPPACNLILCVGSLEPRKNHLGLLKALAALVAEQRWPPHLTLVIVGWPNDARVVQQVQRALALGLPLRWEDKADDQRLLALYEQSFACVYPSLEEGFGLPVAESLWQRRPCLCSNQGALAELAAAGGCLTLDTSDWQAIKQGLAALTTNQALRARLAAEISRRPTRTWSQVGSEWLMQLSQA